MYNIKHSDTKSGCTVHTYVLKLWIYKMVVLNIKRNKFMSLKKFKTSHEIKWRFY